MISVTAVLPWVAVFSIANRAPGKPAAGVVDDVALGGAGPSGDQADGVRQKRQRSLAVGGEQALGGEQLAQLLDPGEQFPQSDLANLGRSQAQRAALGVEVRPGPQDHPSPFGQRLGQHRAVAGDLHRDVRVGVAQGQKVGLHAGPPDELGDLAFDPDLTEPADPLSERLADPAQRQRCFGARLKLAHSGAEPAPPGAGLPSAW